MKLFRQGDVLLQMIDALPMGAKDITPEGKIILAFGEATGHAHAVEERSTERRSARLWSAETERFLQVVEPTALKHEQHGAIALEPGIYRVVQQREYSPEEIRNVAD